MVENGFMEPWMESPHFVGMVVRALAQDPSLQIHSGKVLRTRSLARGYGLRDLDGHEPVLRE